MKRVQLRRGVKLPPNTKSVARPTRWGNPYQVGAKMTVPGIFATDGSGREAEIEITQGMAVTMFRAYANERMSRTRGWIEPLRGHDLACYCPLDQPCHADILLELLEATA